MQDFLRHPLFSKRTGSFIRESRAFTFNIKPKFLDGCQCGKIVGSNYQILPAAVVGRVVGGHVPQIHSIPWQIGIMGT